MASGRDLVRELASELLMARAGVGPLLQRDYWAVIRGCRVPPRKLVQAVATQFAELAPPELVRFVHTSCRTNPTAAPDNPADSRADAGLQVGDELEVDIRLAGTCRVRVVSREPQSLTLATMSGHPEAGRITFGSYRNERGDVVFHIRSKARSSSRHLYVGFLAAGEPMQTTTWADFVIAVARTFGNGVIGAVHVETSRIDDEEGDAEIVGCSPTFVAKGDPGDDG